MNKKVHCAICLKSFIAKGEELKSKEHFCSLKCFKEGRGY